MADEHTRSQRYSTEAEIRAIQIQFDHLEQKVEALQLLAKSVGLLAETIQKHGYILENTQNQIIKMNDDVGRNSDEIMKLRLAPATKWETMKDRVIWVIVGAILLGVVNSILKGVFI